MCRQGASECFRMLEERFWIIEGAEHLMVLTAVFEGVNAVMVRVQIFCPPLLEITITPGGPFRTKLIFMNMCVNFQKTI